MSLTQSKVNLPDILAEKDVLYHNDNSIIGISGLTWPIYTDASRIIMDVHHHSQRVVLDHTEFPRIFGNCENMFGHASTFNIKAKGDLLVHRIIEKFPFLDIPRLAQPEVIIFYNKDREEYDLIYKQDVENLPEKYGFQYDHSILDALNEGDTLRAGTTMTRPTSYDEFDNYGFGANVNTMFRLNMWNLEDAITVSSRLAVSFISTNVYLVKIPLNDNNILGRIYDNGHKCFPDVGDMIENNVLCTKKTLVSAQKLFDLKASNLKKTLPSDIPFLTNGQVVDIDIYCNKPRNEIPNQQYNKQVMQYIDGDIEFHTRLYNETQELIESGKKVSDALRDWNSKCYKLLNKDENDGYLIKDDMNSTFSNIVMYFLVKDKIGLERGQKMCGRYGNKGVISKVVPTREMPHTESGDVIDICYDALGIPNRLIIMPILEKSLAAQQKQISDHIKTLPKLEDKEKIFFRFLEIYNEEQVERVRKDYEESCITKEAKMKYFTDYVETYSIYTNIEPFWQKIPVWEGINKAYDEFADILHPNQIYFWEKRTKRWVKQIKDEYVGVTYVMKLKQTAEKGLSVRGTGPVNNYGLPDKSNDAKKFTVQHSDTAVRLGRQEFENNLMFMDPETIVTEFLFQRNSPVASMALGSKLYDNYEGVWDIKPTRKMTNKNVDILDARLLQMGFETAFEYDLLDLTDDIPGIKTHIYNNEKYVCTTADMRKIIARDIVRLRYGSLESGEVYIGREQDYDDFVDKVADEIKRQIEMYLK